jgi:hypothetical protein
MKLAKQLLTLLPGFGITRLRIHSLVHPLAYGESLHEGATNTLALLLMK